MKPKYKCNCDDLAREIIERNLRGFIRKSIEADESAETSALDADHDFTNQRLQGSAWGTKAVT